MKNCVVFYFLGQIKTLNSIYRDVTKNWSRLVSLNFFCLRHWEWGIWTRYPRGWTWVRAYNLSVRWWQWGKTWIFPSQHATLLQQTVGRTEKKNSLRFSNKLIFFSLFLLHIWHTHGHFFCFMSSRETHFVIIWTVRTRVTQIHWGCWGK